MFTSVVARAVGMGFAVIQLLLVLRLMLPFVTVPSGLEPQVPALRSVTDLLIAPFAGLIDLLSLDLPRFNGAENLIGAGVLDKLDPTVVVAMIGWSLIGLLVVFVVRILGPRHSRLTRWDRLSAF